MPDVKIYGKYVDVDIVAELSAFEFTQPKWSEDKLIAASPFRYDSTPSFFVNLENGFWADSGAYDVEYEKGNFVKLLAFLRDESYEETAEYLTDIYAFEDFTTIELTPITLSLGVESVSLPNFNVTENVNSGYLSQRNISSDTQSVYGTGYNTDIPKHTALPWRDSDGTIANVKYRSTKGKSFIYATGGRKLRELVFGLDVANRERNAVVAVCEAEIDALSWHTASNGSIVGVAVGGVTFTKAQADALLRCGVDTVILAGDNDKAGRKFNEGIRRTLGGYVKILGSDYGTCKDANEALGAGYDFIKTFYADNTA